MVVEFDETLSIPENIQPRDQEVVLLAPMYYWYKFMRRAVSSEDFEFEVPDYDPNDEISTFKAWSGMYWQANSDVEGDVVYNVANILSSHPKRDELFPNLGDSQIRRICTELDRVFEAEEYCAITDASPSYYDVSSPEEFAIDTANVMLGELGGRFEISWYKELSWEERESVIDAILAEKLPGGIGGLLLAGEGVEG